jgi:hypothetical protein
MERNVSKDEKGIDKAKEGVLEETPSTLAGVVKVERAIEGTL